MQDTWEKRRKRIFEIIEVGTEYDYVSRIYDFFNAFCIILNLVASMVYTFDEYRAAYGGILMVIEQATVAMFLLDYLLRIWTAKYLYPGSTQPRAVSKYMTSFTGIVDLLSFLPQYLPFFFPAGAIAFRMFRIIRIFRLFRINAYYDSLNVITEVIVSKKQQLFSSVFIILMLMLASSLCMYSLEHEAQPEVFSNAFSGIWWAASTLLTVGYGDILGVGIVAIPTGIISAGFVDQYSRIKRMSEYGQAAAIHFIQIHLTEQDKWAGKTISQLHLPARVIVAAIQRDHRIIVPRGSMMLKAGDDMVLGAESFHNNQGERIQLKEMVLQKNHPWIGQRIQELDISRKSIIVLVKRKGRTLIPNGNMILREQDMVIFYSQIHMASATQIEV